MNAVSSKSRKTRKKSEKRKNEYRKIIFHVKYLLCILLCNTFSLWTRRQRCAQRAQDEIPMASRPCLCCYSQCLQFFVFVMRVWLRFGDCARDVHRWRRHEPEHKKVVVSAVVRYHLINISFAVWKCSACTFARIHHHRHNFVPLWYRISFSIVLRTVHPGHQSAYKKGYKCVRFALTFQTAERKMIRNGNNVKIIWGEWRQKKLIFRRARSQINTQTQRQYTERFQSEEQISNRVRTWREWKWKRACTECSKKLKILNECLVGIVSLEVCGFCSV